MFLYNVDVVGHLMGVLVPCEAPITVGRGARTLVYIFRADDVEELFSRQGASGLRRLPRRSRSSCGLRVADVGAALLTFAHPPVLNQYLGSSTAEI